MKLRVLVCWTVMCSLAAVAGRSQRQFDAFRFGHPSLAEAGYGHPTDRGRQAVPGAGGRIAQQQRHQPRIHEGGVAQARRRPNSIPLLPGVSWNQIEPKEGKFDFTVLDGLIQEARSHNLRLVPLWFGSWKNSLSSYAPDWVKKDFERFPRAQVAGGKNIELLSALSDANRDADARAFAALLRHIKAVDGQQHTVIMIQVENEVGMHGDSRDRSPAAEQSLCGAGAEGVDGLPPAAQGHADSGVSPGVGGGRLQDIRDLGGGVRQEQGDGWNLHGLELCALHRPGGRGGQSRIPAADVRERGAVRNWEGSPNPRRAAAALGTW